MKNKTFKKDLKFTMKAVLICLIIAVAVRSYIEIKDRLKYSNTPTELNK
ncbi:hypothetical protein [Sphingobacterium multivorum]|nr:hypothetical protein [Sphingobacterium multivorum]